MRAILIFLVIGAASAMALAQVNDEYYLKTFSVVSHDLQKTPFKNGQTVKGEIIVRSAERMPDIVLMKCEFSLEHGPLYLESTNCTMTALSDTELKYTFEVALPKDVVSGKYEISRMYIFWRPANDESVQNVQLIATSGTKREALRLPIDVESSYQLPNATIEKTEILQNGAVVTEADPTKDIVIRTYMKNAKIADYKMLLLGYEIEIAAMMETTDGNGNFTWVCGSPQFYDFDVEAELPRKIPQNLKLEQLTPDSLLIEVTVPGSDYSDYRACDGSPTALRLSYVQGLVNALTGFSLDSDPNLAIKLKR